MNTLQTAIRAAALISSVCCGLTFSSASSAQTAPPSFVPNTPGAVARLGSVENGRATLLDVIPSDWLALPGDAGRNLIHPWSSLTWDYDGRSVYSAGNGGHAATYNNWTFRFDFSGAARAGGWTAVDGSAVEAVIDDADTYTDGRWTSVHSYTAQVIHPDGRLFRYGGSRQNDGRTVSGLWSFQPALASAPRQAYRSHGTGELSGQVFGVVAVYVPHYDKILVVNPNQGQYAVFDPVSNRWSTTARNCSQANAPSAGATGAYDSVRDRLLLIGNGTDRVFEFDGTVLRNAASGNDLRTAGDTSGILGRFAPALTFDPECSCYWAMDLSSNGNAEANSDYGRYLWRIDVPSSVQDAYRFTRSTLTGARIDASFPGVNYLNQPRGGYGKLGALRGWDALALVHKVGDATYVIRKPGSSCAGAACVDTDADGITDDVDNCLQAPNGPLRLDAGGASQRDADGDGYGNACDADLTNDGQVNTSDLARFRLAYGTTSSTADFNGSGRVEAGDLALMRASFGRPPGPSGRR